MRVGIAGLGAVGLAAARALDTGIAGLTLGAVSAAHLDRARQRVAGFATPPTVVRAPELSAHADVIVECAPAAAFRQIAEPALEAGRKFLAISVGALLQHWDLVALAERHGAQIIIPSGALLGLDAVQAAALGEIHSVRMITTKPPTGLAGAPYLEAHGIDVLSFTRAQRIFSGSAAEGARHFPANANVAAALGLAGLGPDKTELEIWADPAIERNRHEIIVESDSAYMELKIENLPSHENPRTGKIVSQSVVATLRKLVSPLAVGT